MKFSPIYFLAAAQLALGATSPKMNATDMCYHTPMPNGTVSNETRKVPWGSPTIKLANGTTCCSSLDQVQTALDDIDAKLLYLLSNRTLYSREAARFKSKEADIDDPKEGKRVVQRAIEGAHTIHLPQNVAKKVFQSIVKSSVEFQDCIYKTRNGTL